jgi:hypothetical protein
MIRIDEPTTPLSAPHELRLDVERRSARYRHRRRVRTGAMAGAALAIVSIVGIGLTGLVGPQPATTRVGSGGDRVSDGADGGERAPAGRASPVGRDAGRPTSTTAVARPGSDVTALTPPVVGPATAPGNTPAPTQGGPIGRTEVLFLRHQIPYEVSDDGSPPRQVANAAVDEPRWAPDRSALLARSSGDIVLIDSATGKWTYLFDHRQEDQAFSAEWMPDGRSVVFIRLQPGGQFEVWEVDVGTRQLRRLGPRPADDASVSVAPDGRVAYSCTVDKGRLCLTDRSGADLGVVPESTHYWTHSWSPDGRWVAATVPADGNHGNRLLLVRADGSESRVVLSQGVGARVAWSPDGSRLFFDFAADGGAAGVRSVALDGTGGRWLTTNPGDRVADARLS